MKKILYTLTILGCLAFVFGSCEGPEGPPGASFEAEVIELVNVNFNLDSNNEFTIYRKLNPRILPGDVLLIYRLDGWIDSFTPIWQLIPRTIYIKDPSGAIQYELDYDYDFSREDFTIYATGPADFSSPLVRPYISNQTFRIVIVPGSLPNNIDVSDYTTVVNLLNIDQNAIKRIDANK